MAAFVENFLKGIDSFFAWLSAELKQTVESYCELETADKTDDNIELLVTKDGSAVSFIKIQGVKELVGEPEFRRLLEGLTLSLGTAMSRPGHAVQVYFGYDGEHVNESIEDVLLPAKRTANRLGLNLDDLFAERIDFLSRYCADESVYFVLWTRPGVLTSEQEKRAAKEKLKQIRAFKTPPFKNSQNILATIPDLRNPHQAFVRSLLNDLDALGIKANLLNAHDSVKAMRICADKPFTDHNWRATLPGDMIPAREVDNFQGTPSDILWPSLAKQIMPRDAENLDLRTVRMGDYIYSAVFIDLFPKDIKPFVSLFQRTLAAQFPWRISFFIESEGLRTMSFKSLMAAILSFSSENNRLLSDATNLLKYIAVNTDESIVRLRVAAATWAPENDIRLLRTRTSELAKAIEGWGSCDVSEVCGDPFAGIVSSLLGVTSQNVATASVAPLSDVVYMLPITRPASLWQNGALLFRSPDGKLWPFQPGSSLQVTWITLIFARPGSGKSVLSNAILLALCLSAGIQRLPRIAIIDIGPSSSGLISLLKEALPYDKKHQVMYHRLRLTPEYSINPFDTQLGCRFPTPQERVFLVNFLTLLTTPLGGARPYDGMPDLAGMVVDTLYKNLADDGKAYNYTSGVEPIVDGILEEIGFVQDQSTTWWEVTDALFMAGFAHEAMLAQRYAMPLLADAASVCRTQAIEDLYGQIIAPTGETLINAFARMISAAVREYPILSRVTHFDLGDAKVVALDLDEVAKSGGDAADRQTAIMYMLARYVLARHYYLNEENVKDMTPEYREYHQARVAEIREDHKCIVYDEFHRTSKSEAVRNQVLVDMREGRKWRVQISLISQSVEDFDPTMVEFATAIYIMDAGPEQAIQKTASIFGLSETAQVALRTRVHGPQEGGATFLAQYATKYGINTQLLTLTLGPIELWAFSTTAEDTKIRDQLYKRIGSGEARRVLAALFPSGTAGKLVEARLNALRTHQELITEESKLSVVDQLIEDILAAYSKNPDVKRLPI